jgi:hypothetical protein
MKELSEAAVILGDRELGAELTAMLEPFADRMVVSARGLFGLGAVPGALGRLAELAGDQASAIRRYEDAVERDERAGAVIWAVHHRRRLAEALIAEGHPERGYALLARVAAEGARSGLPHQAELARARLGQ